MGELEILPLTAERFADVATLFGQGGDPKWCWCSYYRLRNVDFASGSAGTNRKVLEGALERTSLDGREPGLLAYREGDVVGWVSVGPREDYQRILHSKVLAPIDERPVWSIVCFVVSRSARRSGVATALLHAAIDYARDHGATLAESYPIETDGRRVPAAQAYKGTVGMFRREGFEIAARRQFNRTTRVRPIMRREL